MKQKQPKTLSKNQKLLKKARDNKPTPAQERKALNQLSKKDPDLYFRQKQKQINRDIKNSTNKRKTIKSSKSTKSTKSSKSSKSYKSTKSSKS